MKAIFIFAFLFLGTCSAYAQVDTTSYPKERQEIRQILRNQRPGTLTDCVDMIAVGPKGDISFTYQQWVEAQQKEKLVFKSVRPVPGNEFIRIYDGTTAVVNILINVALVVDGWCRVAGQGTQVDENLFPVNSK